MDNLELTESSDHVATDEEWADLAELAQGVCNDLISRRATSFTSTLGQDVNLRLTRPGYTYRGEPLSVLIVVGSHWGVSAAEQVEA